MYKDTFQESLHIIETPKIKKFKATLMNYQMLWNLHLRNALKKGNSIKFCHKILHL